MVGTDSDRFTIKVPPDESSWVATRIRAELIKRELAAAEELPVDEAGEIAMAAKATAKTLASNAAAAKKAAKKAAAANPVNKAAAALEAAQHHEKIAEQKRRFAEGNLQVAQQHRKISKVLQQVTEVVETLPAAAPIHRPSWRHFCSGRR